MKMSDSSEVGLINDAHRIKRVRYREPAVIMTIMSLFFLCLITTAVEDVMLKTIRTPGVLSLWKLCQTIIPLPAIYLFMFLSNYTGRKPVIAILFLLCILSTVLHSISLAHSPIWLFLAFAVQSLMNSGTMIMTILGIWEYSSSKNKMTYAIANAGVWQTTEYTRKSKLYSIMLRIDPLYMKVIAILVGVVCLGWTLQWPETPFWLTSKQKTEESRTASLWLHGEEELQNEERIQASQESQESTEPPKLYGISLLMLTFSITIYKSVVWYTSYKVVNPSVEFISNEMKTGLLICTFIFVMCSSVLLMKDIKQKFALFIVFGLTAVYFIFRYLGEPLVTALYTVGAHPTLIYVLNRVYTFMNNCGPLILCVGFLVKIVPLEYRTLAFALLSYIQLGLASMMLIFAIIVR